MAEAVYSPINVESFEEEQEKPSKTYRLDLNAGRITGSADGAEAVQQAIRKALVTPRFDCLVYDDQYGSDIRGAFLNATPEYIETSAEELIRDTLRPDSRIIDISDVNVDFNGDECYISFTAQTVFGEISTEVNV